MNPNEYGLDHYRDHLAWLIEKPSWRDAIKPTIYYSILALQINRRAPKQEIRQIDRILACMTPEERRNPSAISSPRRLEIAANAGVYAGDLATLFFMFEKMRGIVDQMIAFRSIEQLRRIFGADVELPPRPDAEPEPVLSKPMPSRPRQRPQSALAMLRRRTKGLFGEWDLRARAGRRAPAPEHEHLFSRWNQDLMLWSFNAND